MRLCDFSQAHPELPRRWIGPVTPAGLRPALTITLVAGLAAAVAAALARGGPGVWGVVVGVALLAGFFLFGLVTMQVAAALTPTASLLLALLTYTLQVVLLGLAFVVLQRSGLLDTSIDRRWLSGTVVVGTLVWTVMLVRGAVRQRIPLYHTPSDLAKSRDGASPDASRSDPKPG
jgi:ATP synthase protein I